MNRRQDKICNDALAFWKRLGQVKQVSFVAHSHSQAGVNWHRQGTGRVTISQKEPHILVFDEKGTWLDEAGKDINFSNTLRWTLDIATPFIDLEHLRLGLNKPTFLLRLAPSGPLAWSSTKPHLCAKDTYTGKITLDKDQIKLTWYVRGPKKDEFIESCYY